MKHEEVRFLLGACRPDGSDVEDPALAEAFAHMGRDPSLMQWFSREQAMDRAVAEKLAEVVPPQGLREAILAGARAEMGPASQHAWWRSPAWMGIAASLILLLGVIGFLGKRAEAAPETIAEFASDYIAGSFFLSQRSANLDELKGWLSRQHAPLPSELPNGFRQLRSLGCKTLSYNGKDITLICFGEGKEYHLFVARRSDYPDITALPKPQYLERKGLAAASWSDAENHYVVVTDDTLKALRECLNCPGGA